MHCIKDGTNIDPRCATGRTFLVAKDLGWQGAFCSVETNPRAHRICLLNIATYELPVYMVNKPTPPDMSHENWEHYNRWNNAHLRIEKSEVELGA